MIMDLWAFLGIGIEALDFKDFTRERERERERERMVDTTTEYKVERERHNEEDLSPDFH